MRGREGGGGGGEGGRKRGEREEGGRKVIKRSVYTCMSSLSCRSSTSQAGDQHIITSSPVSPPSQQAHTHNDNNERSQRVPATQVVVATDSVRADVDNIVLRAERELEPVEWNQDVHSGIGSNYHESNLLPDTADDMGPGN